MIVARGTRGTMQTSKNDGAPQARPRRPPRQGHDAYMYGRRRPPKRLVAAGTCRRPRARRGRRRHGRRARVAREPLRRHAAYARGRPHGPGRRRGPERAATAVSGGVRLPSTGRAWRDVGPASGVDGVPEVPRQHKDDDAGDARGHHRRGPQQIHRRGAAPLGRASPAARSAGPKDRPPARAGPTPREAHAPRRRGPRRRAGAAARAPARAPIKGEDVAAALHTPWRAPALSCCLSRRIRRPELPAARQTAAAAGVSAIRRAADSVNLAPRPAKAPAVGDDRCRRRAPRRDGRHDAGVRHARRARGRRRAGRRRRPSAPPASSRRRRSACQCRPPYVRHASASWPA